MSRYFKASSVIIPALLILALAPPRATSAPQGPPAGHGAYLCAGESWEKPCRWYSRNELGDQKCIQTDQNVRSVGPDPGVFCIAYQTADCKEEVWFPLPPPGLPYDTINNPGEINLDVDVKSFKCRQI
ncbi:hypothetical protein K458DRAFT_382979 [Lentithecium fluviatile CBS 122367]|uniref:Secreted protein n=1 Tax=Lentithecium fluviatile CBS 122367 TaxID=1168545 RepID=A0A6G1JHY2_9PLEO|nr:hypothetical protein K458DRAFT_382979 [Lentithecium fluviatile CBS 122367]